ncbi:MAG TPA: UDP-3-O-(3-hydroxymyristoyl)glucosamine N-acyltransferase [Pyrinomonadaceae bacterium]|jgi:UDP-3-O-[3-hydroxymyristoyl] glucosamine N-acyltransferase|nr:UDP-3-O-(3-hydroxymyristoyl)glucosamine N-acyltransferase [Pyrinomonadaceae bacterium]
MNLFDLATETGAVCAVTDGNIEIKAAAGLDEAEPGDVTFLSNPKYTNRVATTRASAIYVTDDVSVERDDIAVLRTRDPYLAFTRALVLFHPRPSFEAGIDPAAVIELSAKTGEGTFIGARSVIGAHVIIGDRVRIHPSVTVYENVTIDDDCEIHSGVAIRANTVIGKRVIIHNNAVIGSDGFGFAKDEDKHWLKIPQVGRVVIEDDVEIGANTTIDRASTGETRIKRGAKIDNLVQIGHSCIVGEDALLCAQVGLAGSSRIGDRVILTGQVGIGGHITVGDDAILYPQSGVPNDVAPGEILVGTPAFEVSAFWRAVAVFKKLGDIPKRIRALEKRLDEVEKSQPQQ